MQWDMWWVMERLCIGETNRECGCAHPADAPELLLLVDAERRVAVGRSVLWWDWLGREERVHFSR